MQTMNAKEVLEIIKGLNSNELQECKDNALECYGLINDSSLLMWGKWAVILIIIATYKLGIKHGEERKNKK